MLVEFKIIDEDTSAGCAPHAIERVHQHGLARARGTEHADKFIWLNGQAYIVKQLSRCPPRLVHDLGNRDGIDANFRSRIKDRYAAGGVHSEHKRPNLHHVLVLNQMSAADSSAIHINAVRRAGVFDLDSLRRVDKTRVMLRDEQSIELNIILRSAADRKILFAIKRAFKK